MFSNRKAFILIALFGTIGCGDHRSDEQKIEGRWRIISAERFKKSMPEPVGQVWAFADGTVTFSQDDWTQTTTFSLNSNKSPTLIEIGPTDNPRSQIGICSINQAKLRLCLTRWDDPRPDEFTTEEFDNRVLFDFERAD